MTKLSHSCSTSPEARPQPIRVGARASLTGSRSTRASTSRSSRAGLSNGSTRSSSRVARCPWLNAAFSCCGCPANPARSETAATHREAKSISTELRPRPRHLPGAGRAPARIPPAVWRRPRGAARSGPRRRSRHGAGKVIRRRPTAVYRVIDEEELLGGTTPVERGIVEEGWPLSGSEATGNRRRGPSRPRTGWASTALAAAALAAVAAALLSLGGNAGASNASDARQAARGRMSIRAGSPARISSHRVAPAAAHHAKAGLHVIVGQPRLKRLRGTARARLRRGVTEGRLPPVAGAAPAAAARSANPPPSPAEPVQEFGFER